ncbi:MAG: LLM class flavin-dependent oxidoreductase [Thermoprotei archaeon]
MSVSVMVSGNGELPVESVSAISKMCEQTGKSAIWIGETTVRDAAVMAALSCFSTTKISVGTSVVNVYTRTAGQLAMMASTLNSLSKGRFILGVGTSTETIVSGWHGVSFRSPMQTMEEVVKLLRLYFSGERFEFKGKMYSPTNARMRTEWDQKLAVAALNPSMVRLAASLADEVVLNLYPPRLLGEAKKIVEEQSARNARGKPKLAAVVYSHVLGHETGIEAAKELLAFYGSAPAYAKLFVRAGFPEQASEMLSAWSARNRNAAKQAVTQQMIDELLYVGDVNGLKERIAEYLSLGVDEVIVAPFPFGNYYENIQAVSSACIQP